MCAISRTTHGNTVSPSLERVPMECTVSTAEHAMHCGTVSTAEYLQPLLDDVDRDKEHTRARLSDRVFGMLSSHRQSVCMHARTHGYSLTHAGTACERTRTQQQRTARPACDCGMCSTVSHSAHDMVGATFTSAAKPAAKCAGNVGSAEPLNARFAHS
jgi:hypothetical protein